MRAIVLKARKLGFSTWVAAKFLQRLTQMPYQAAVVVAQDVKTAGVLFDMARLMHRHLPTQEQLGLGSRSARHRLASSFSPNGRKFMEFGYGAPGAIQGRRRRVAAGDRHGADTGIGPRLHAVMVHGSEVAWWPDNGKLLGLLNAVPDEPETIVVLESTANGFNHFRKRWLRAVEGQEDPTSSAAATCRSSRAGGRTPTAAAAVPLEEARERFVASIGTGPYGEDEPMLVERFGCTPEQLLWRRTTIRDRDDDDRDLFKQEYPASPEEAFIGSGASVFGGILVPPARSTRLGGEGAGAGASGPRMNGSPWASTSPRPTSRRAR
jgi:hypothetical protein